MIQFKTVKAAIAFIKDLRVSRGYSSASTVEWRRLSMKLSDPILIQFARRLALRLETEKSFLVGLDEQDFNTKIYVLNRNKYCVLSLMKQIDETTKKVTYTLGYVGEKKSNYMLNINQLPTDEDLTYALTLIGSISLEIRTKKDNGNEKNPIQDNGVGGGNLDRSSHR